MSHSPRTRLTKVKLLLLGSSSVGKTAFAVRYLTRRFIGEYDPNKEMLYTHKMALDRDEVNLDILDTAHEMSKSEFETHVRWADGFILMCSVTDKSSYQQLADIFHDMQKARKVDENTPLVVVANKTDLTFARKVSETELSEMGGRLKCQAVYEISIAESPEGVMEAMDEVLRQVKREFVKSVNHPGGERKSAFNNVKRVLKKKIYRSRSDTM